MKSTQQLSKKKIGGWWFIIILAIISVVILLGIRISNTKPAYILTSPHLQDLDGIIYVNHGLNNNVSEVLPKIAGLLDSCGVSRTNQNIKIITIPQNTNLPNQNTIVTRLIKNNNWHKVCVLNNNPNGLNNYTPIQFQKLLISRIYKLDNNNNLVYLGKPNYEGFEDINPTTTTSTPTTTKTSTMTVKNVGPEKVYRVRFVEPRTCYSKIENNDRYRMQSYQQLFDYWFPNMKCEMVPENEPADIALIGNHNSDNSVLKPNEVNILISIENMPRWNMYAHYTKYGDYNDPMIDIFIYNHKYEIERLDKGKIMIPALLFRTNYFLSNYNSVNVNENSYKDKMFCISVNKSGLNSFVGQCIEKIKEIGPVDHISKYDKEIENLSCYNTHELLKVFNKYRFVICFENSYNDGYVTEKIFNCLFANTIPIYSGSSKIEEIINPDCFINVPENSDMDALVEKIKKINASEEEYNKYIKTSPKTNPNYSDDNFKELYKQTIDNKLDSL